MNPTHPEYLTYLLRVWRAGSADEPACRVSLENPSTGERQAFRDLAALCAFLEERVQSYPWAGEDTPLSR